MAIDYLFYAKHLNIVPVHQAGNSSGFVTPDYLYKDYKPFSAQGIIIHATAGTNTLPYFMSGSAGRNVLAHQLIPTDDYTIYDLVPRGFGCGHCNPGLVRGVGNLNYKFYGIEVENPQDGHTAFAESQYIKLALTIAYKSALDHIPNLMVTDHYTAAYNAVRAGLEPIGAAHLDPNAGPFDWAAFYGHLQHIRDNAAIFTYWGVPQWTGR